MNIDILVLTHNRLEITQRFVDLLYSNTKNFNLFIWDNGSTDKTPDYLINNKNQNFNYILNKENLGVINGRNSLFNYVLGKGVSDFVCFLDNDQFVQSGWLEDHFKFIEKGCDIVGVEGWWMDSFWIPHRCKKKHEAFDYVGCGGMLMKSDVPKAIGLFDERFNPAYFEDPDFCLKAYNAGYKIGWNADAKITHLAHQTLGRDSSWKEKFEKSHIKFLDKWNKHPHPKMKNIL